MHPPKQIAGFFLKLLVFYALLAAPWPGLQEAYSGVYSAVANSVFGSFGSDGKVRFRALAEGAGKMDAEFVLYTRKSLVVPKIPHSARRTGYLPTAQVLALILATPIPWPRKWKALLWGLLAVHVFIFLRLEITLLHWFSMDEPWALYKPSPLGRSLLSGLYEVGADSPMLNVGAPVFIWIVATFRRSDFERWRDVVRKTGPRTED